MVAVVEVDTEDDDAMKAASIKVFNSAAKGAKVGGLAVVSAVYDPKYVPAPTDPDDAYMSYTCEGPDGAVDDGWSGKWPPPPPPPPPPHTPTPMHRTNVHHSMMHLLMKGERLYPS